jgi:exonuclease VII large subunit
MCFNYCPGISDARAIPQQLAQSCVPHEYRQSVLDTLEQTVSALQRQLVQTVAQQRTELQALDRSHNVARSAYHDGLQSAEAARAAQLDSAYASQVAEATRSLTSRAEALHRALASLSAVSDLPCCWFGCLVYI